MNQFMDNIQTLAHAVKVTGNAINAVVAVVKHPIASIQHLGLWGVGHGEIFAAVGIVGILLWLFGLRAGKKTVQWVIAVYALVAIIAGVLG